MKIPFRIWLALALGLVVLNGRASGSEQLVDLGQNTYSITRTAKTGFTHETDKLTDQALKDAQDFCAQHHKELKILSQTSYHPKLRFTGYANAKIVFKALDANDPELHTPVPEPAAPSVAEAGVSSAQPTATGALYADLMKLDDLRKRGILTEEEFQAQKKKLLEKSN